MNFGRATDTTTAAYAGEWHELSRAQHDALTVAAIGDTVLQTTARLYRDFIDPTITNTAGITARDVYIGKDADLRLIVASANASEDAYPATVIYETETEVTVRDRRHGVSEWRHSHAYTYASSRYVVRRGKRKHGGN